MVFLLKYVVKKFVQLDCALFAPDEFETEEFSLRLQASARYDSRTTIFSPEGRLYQVEYAIEAISQAGAAVGILARDGVVLAAEKRITSKLLDQRKSTEKMYKIDDHCAVAVAGITADANILLNYARVEAQRYTYMYNEPIPIEQLIQIICDLKQSYTQYGGLRPFGVSFLCAGWDEHFGFQLYQTDPSGNFSGWKAKAIGANNPSAQSILKEDYKSVDQTSVEDAELLAVKVLSKTMDTTSPTPDRMEFASVRRVDGKVVYHVYSKAELEALLKRAESMLLEQKKKQEKESVGDI